MVLWDDPIWVWLEWEPDRVFEREEPLTVRLRREDLSLLAIRPCVEVGESLQLLRNRYMDGYIPVRLMRMRDWIIAAETQRLAFMCQLHMSNRVFQQCIQVYVKYTKTNFAIGRNVIAGLWDAIQAHGNEMTVVCYIDPRAWDLFTKKPYDLDAK